MLPYRDSRLTKLALGAFFVLAAGYALFEARNMLFGPSITVPTRTIETRDALITITGRANHISALFMNGAQVAVTEDGTFEEPFVLAEGLNRIVLDAKDKYDRRTQKIIEVVYSPPDRDTNTPGAPSASSTEPVAPLR